MANIHEWINSISLADPNRVWIITYTTEKSKTSVTGKYISHDLTEVILLNEKGKFRKIPVDKIIRIKYYWEGREPF